MFIVVPSSVRSLWPRCVPLILPLSLVILVLLACLPPARAAGNTAGALQSAGFLSFPGSSLAWLRDSSGALTVEAVAARAADFQPLPGGSLSRGYTRDVYWLRLVLPAAVQGGEFWLEVPPGVLDDVRLYGPQPGNGWLERRGGDMLPFDSREAPYRNTAFRLAQAQAGQVLYLRIQTTSVMAALPRLWRPVALQAANDADTLGYGLYLGFMATVLMLNLVGWAVTRRSLHGLFALFVGCGLLRWFAVDGLASQYLFPHDPLVPALVTNALLGDGRRHPHLRPVAVPHVQRRQDHP